MNTVPDGNFEKKNLKTETILDTLSILYIDTHSRENESKKLNTKRTTMRIQEFKVNGRKRFRIVNQKDPTMVINDAQGYGFKSFEKALAFIEGRKILSLDESYSGITNVPLF